jgi:ABC-type lipoprotein export system ATPase subunit
VLAEFTTLACEAGSALVIVSRDDEVVDKTDRVISLRDGRIASASTWPAWRDGPPPASELGCWRRPSHCR